MQSYRSHDFQDTVPKNKTIGSTCFKL